MVDNTSDWYLAEVLGGREVLKDCDSDERVGGVSEGCGFSYDTFDYKPLC